MAFCDRVKGETQNTIIIVRLTPGHLHDIKQIHFNMRWTQNLPYSMINQFIKQRHFTIHISYPDQDCFLTLKDCDNSGFIKLFLKRYLYRWHIECLDRHNNLIKGLFIFIPKDLKYYLLKINMLKGIHEVVCSSRVHNTRRKNWIDIYISSQLNIKCYFSTGKHIFTGYEVGCLLSGLNTRMVGLVLIPVWWDGLLNIQVCCICKILYTVLVTHGSPPGAGSRPRRYPCLPLSDPTPTRYTHPVNKNTPPLKSLRAYIRETGNQTCFESLEYFNPKTRSMLRWSKYCPCWFYCVYTFLYSDAVCFKTYTWLFIAKTFVISFGELRRHFIFNSSRSWNTF